MAPVAATGIQLSCTLAECNKPAKYLNMLEWNNFRCADCYGKSKHSGRWELLNKPAPSNEKEKTNMPSRVEQPRCGHQFANQNICGEIAHFSRHLTKVTCYRCVDHLPNLESEKWIPLGLSNAGKTETLAQLDPDGSVDSFTVPVCTASGCYHRGAFRHKTKPGIWLCEIHPPASYDARSWDLYREVQAVEPKKETLSQLRLNAEQQLALARERDSARLALLCHFTEREAGELIEAAGMDLVAIRNLQGLKPKGEPAEPSRMEKWFLLVSKVASLNSNIGSMPCPACGVAPMLFTADSVVASCQQCESEFDTNKLINGLAEQGEKFDVETARVERKPDPCAHLSIVGTPTGCRCVHCGEEWMNGEKTQKESARDAQESAKDWEDGDLCPRSDCFGLLIFKKPVDCSCHVVAPCGACEEVGLECGECKWHPGDEIGEPTTEEEQHAELKKLEAMTPEQLKRFTGMMNRATMVGGKVVVSAEPSPTPSVRTGLTITPEPIDKSVNFQLCAICRKPIAREDEIWVHRDFDSSNRHDARIEALCTWTAFGSLPKPCGAPGVLWCRNDVRCPKHSMQPDNYGNAWTLVGQENLHSGLPEQPSKEQAHKYDMSIHSNPDAVAWAKFFIRTVSEVAERNYNRPGFQKLDTEVAKLVTDQAYMHGWFANAMMAMHDFQAGREQKERASRPALAKFPDETIYDRLPEPVIDRIKTAIGEASMQWTPQPVAEFFDAEGAAVVALRLAHYFADKQDELRDSMKRISWLKLFILSAVIIGATARLCFLFR